MDRRPDGYMEDVPERNLTLYEIRSQSPVIDLQEIPLSGAKLRAGAASGGG